MRVLDLFCGAGGASMGYHRAWPEADIVGVDIVPQPDYPFTFIQGDALRPPVDLDAFDFIHASPPCQNYTPLSRRRGGTPRYDRMIEETLELIGDRHYVLENVVGSHVDMPGYFIRMHGGMFGLRVHRERLFASDRLIMAPPEAPRVKNPIGVYGEPSGRWLNERSDGTRQYAWSSLEEGRELLGVPWITDKVQIAEAIPPVYTQWIGEQLGQT